MNNTELANAQRLRTQPPFRVDKRGILRFVTGERARGAEIQSTNVSIRRNSGNTAPLWFGWLAAGLVVNMAMGSSNSGEDYNAWQSLVLMAGLFGGPVAILVYRNRQGVFVDVEGSGSLITSIHVGNRTPENEAKAYALADEVIQAAEDNS